MALTGAQDDAGRLVETYSSMLLRLACTRLEKPRRRGGCGPGGVFEAADGPPGFPGRGT